jgi:hypothetical protein
MLKEQVPGSGKPVQIKHGHCAPPFRFAGGEYPALSRLQRRRQHGDVNLHPECGSSDRRRRPNILLRVAQQTRRRQQRFSIRRGVAVGLLEAVAEAAGCMACG